MIYMKVFVSLLLWTTLVVSLSEAQVDATMLKQTGPKQTMGGQTAVDRAVKRVLSDRFDVNKKELKTALAQIELELVADVDMDEPEPNLEQIIDKLEQTEDTSGILASRLNGLQLLASLDRVWKGVSKCNHESYTILSKNNEALGLTVQVPASQFPTRPHRMQLVLRKIALKHAQDCKDVYPDRYYQLVQTFSPDHHQVVKTFFDLVRDVHIKNSKPSWSLFGASTPKLVPSDALNAQKVIKSFKSLDVANEAAIAYDFLKNYIQDDPDQWYLTRVPRSETDNRLVLNQTKIRQLLQRHLIEPSAQYVALLGPDVFEPAEFDAQIWESDDRHLNPDLIDFQQARIRYHLGKRLIRNDENRLQKHVFEVASRAPIHQFNQS